MVKKVEPNGYYTIYIGGMYEVRKNASHVVTGSTTYYPAAGAMRVDGTLYFVLGDQLGSTSVVVNAGGSVVGEARYYPFGKTRYSTGTLFTDRLYTGQQEITGLGLYNYKARFYDPLLGKFISPDSITPGGPQGLNRYAYVNNNPIRYNDPTGHCVGAGNHEFPDGSPACNTEKKDPPKYTPPQLPCESIGGLYGTTCNNLNQAARILYNPNATFGQRVGSGYYISVVGMSHAAVAVGLAGLTCGLTECYMAAVPLLTKLATVNPNSLSVSIGSNGIYQKVGEAYEYTYLQMGDWLYNLFDDLGMSEVINAQFITNQIEQGKSFVVSVSLQVPGKMTQAEMQWIEISEIYTRISPIDSPFRWIYHP
jgi:RHS repeat-associated protein